MFYEAFPTKDESADLPNASANRLALHGTKEKLR